MDKKKTEPHDDEKWNKKGKLDCLGICVNINIYKVINCNKTRRNKEKYKAKTLRLPSLMKKKLIFKNIS